MRENPAYCATPRLGSSARAGTLCQLPVQHDPLGGQLEVGVVENVSLPSMESPASAGGLTSRITSLSLPIVGLSPATGTLWFGQVAGRTSSSERPVRSRIRHRTAVQER